MDLDLIKRQMWLRKLFLKLHLPVSFPMIVNIEPTNRCTLACTICPRRLSGRPEVDLDWDLFLALADEIAANGPIMKIFLQKDGEPLLHPRIVEMVRVLREKNCAKNISVITNGTVLTEALFSSLAEAGLDDLIISIDTVDPEEYLHLKGVDCLGRVERNVHAAIRLKKEHGWLNPRVKARMVSRKGKEDEVAAFCKKWKDAVDMVDITPYHTWMGSVKDERNYQKGSRYPCSLLWYTGVVNADGKVSPCCIDYNEAGVIGGIQKAGLKGIWNGPRMNVLRMAHLRGNYHKTEICGPCEYWLIKEDLGSWLRRKYSVIKR